MDVVSGFERAFSFIVEEKRKVKFLYGKDVVGMGEDQEEDK